jgi:hypothetical protein
MNPAVKRSLAVVRKQMILYTNFQCRHELGECNKQEVQVEEELELLVKDDGKEGKRVVFLISYSVGWKTCLKLL